MTYNIRMCPVCGPYSELGPVRKDNFRDYYIRINYHNVSMDRTLKVMVRNVVFYVNLYYLAGITQRFKEVTSVSEVLHLSVSVTEFHDFIEATCPTIFGCHPVPITETNIVNVIKMATLFDSPAYLSLCEQALMLGNIRSMHPSVYYYLLSLCGHLDNKRFNEIVCLCIVDKDFLRRVLFDYNDDETGAQGETVQKIDWDALHTIWTVYDHLDF